MKTLKEVIGEARSGRVAIGHFNFSNLEGLRGIFAAAQELSSEMGSLVPLIVSVSEGERDFVGTKEARALVDVLRSNYSYPIWLSADHTSSFERAKEVIDAGYDLIVFDQSHLSLEENIIETKKCVDYAREVNPDILVEGELGYIGKSSKLLDKLPEGLDLTADTITSVAEAERLVTETGVDLFSPAVGNIHGLLKNSPNPRLFLERTKELSQALNLPLVLHGGSGISDEDFIGAIDNGVAIIHINSELRLAYKQGLKRGLEDMPEEIAPYKLLKPAVWAVKEATLKRLRLFSRA